MNIVMFTNTYLPHVGGVARSVLFFSQDLRKLGHNVLIVAPTFPEMENQNESDTNVLRVPAIQNFNGSDFSVRIPIPFLIDEKIDEFKPHVIHSHHPFLLGDAAIRAAFRRGLPLVFTHHTLYESYTHYVSSESETMQNLAVNLSTEYANLCTRVVAPSESIAELITERGVDTPIDVIPTGVDVSRFQAGDRQAFRRDHNIGESTVVIGHLGRLAPEKNLDYLCRAVCRAMEDNNAENMMFLVVGTGPSETRIKDIFRQQGLESRLIMAGQKSGTDLVNAYAAMDLFVFSSQSETQGMVLAEAMAASLPVIALDAPGAREVVTDNYNGRLFEADVSPDVFATGITRFIEDKNTAGAWRKAAFNTALKFSRDQSALKMAALYQSLPAAARPPHDTPDSFLEPLEELFHSIKIEWDMITRKTRALFHAVKPETKET